jgi:hypothetical protein
MKKGSRLDRTTLIVLKKIEEDFKAIYLFGKRAKREITVPVEEFVEI